MTLTVPPGRPPIPIEAKDSGGFQALGLGSAPTGAPSISSVVDNGDGTLTISGSNFGSKAQAAPVLFDTVDVAYENGVANTFHGSSPDGTVVAGFEASGNSNEVYEVAKNATINKTDRPRVAGTACYRLDGGECYVGWPRAYGGKETPDANTDLYAAWWFRRYHHWFHYWIVPGFSSTGTFIVDESIEVVGTTATARFLGERIDPTDGPVYYFETKSTATDIYKGRTFRGVTSGAEIAFPTTFRGGSGTGYETPGTKYNRIRDNQNGLFMAGILTPFDFFFRYEGSNTAYDTIGFNETPPDSWEFHEMWVNVNYSTNTGFYRAWVNGRYRGQQSLSGISLDPTKSLSISLLGNDAFEWMQKTDLDFYYQDKSPQRVYLADADTFDACTHFELQRPSAWSSSAITVAKYEGALSGTKWVYVAGPDGSVNSQGVSV